jgi:hypothetical protein
MTALLRALLMSTSAQDDREPPLIFTLEVAGKPVTIEPDQAVEIEAAGKVPVIPRVAPHRVFRLGGLDFHYPRGYGFEADLSDPEMHTWTLSGNDHKIMVFRYPGNPAHEAQRAAVLDQMKAAYKGKSRQEVDEIVLAGRTLKGARVHAELVGAGFTQRVFSFATAKDGYLLILQDSPQAGKPTPEAVTAEKFFTGTFAFPK